MKHILNNNQQKTNNNRNSKFDKRQLTIIGKKSLSSAYCLFSASKGFSLIEILVAASIIALLSTIGLNGFQVITRNGRDALRKSDLEAIRSALEIYKSENNAYPQDDGNCQPDFNQFTSDYINYPTDPKSPSLHYCYIRDSELSYRLCAHLENGNSEDQYCGADTACGQNCSYQVRNP